MGRCKDSIWHMQSMSSPLWSGDVKPVPYGRKAPPLLARRSSATFCLQYPLSLTTPVTVLAPGCCSTRPGITDIPPLYNSESARAITFSYCLINSGTQRAPCPCDLQLCLPKAPHVEQPLNGLRSPRLHSKIPPMEILFPGMRLQLRAPPLAHLAAQPCNDYSP